MEELVTLKLGRYEALRDKARRVDALEKENEQLKEENKLLKAQKAGLPDEAEFYDTPYGKVVVINGKQIKLKNGNIQLCNKKNDTPVREERMGNMKIAESMEEFRERLRARYPEGVRVIYKDDPMKSIRLCDKYIYSIKDDGNVRHVGTIEKQSNENVDEKVRLAGLEISSLLKEKYHPHMSVLITSNGVTMLEDYLFVPNN